MIIKTMEELGRALDKGEEIQWLESNSYWIDIDANIMTLRWYREQIEEGNLRIAPKMVFIEGVGGRYEYPEPMSEKPEEGQKYYKVYITSVCTSGYIWCSHPNEQDWLKNKCLHLTEEAAEQHLQAYKLAMGISDD